MGRILKNIVIHLLSFFATVAFEDEIDFVKDIDCESIKIASADVNYFELIRKASKTGLSIQLDTGIIQQSEKLRKLLIVRSIRK